MTPFTDDIWLDEGPTSIVGMKLTSTMTVLRLADDSLLLYSPIALTDERRAAVERLGTVKHLYAPNLFHHLWIGDWAERYPDARVHAPPGLDKKRPDLRIDRLHGSGAEPAFAGVLEERPIEGCRLGESVLLHRKSGTLVVADLVHNVGRPTQRWAVLYTKLSGFYDEVALSRVLRWTAFSDREAARRCIDDILAQDFDRMVVGHGAPLASGARDALRAAFTWLK